MTMYGTPGASLRGSGASGKFGVRASVGAVGETSLAQTLQASGITKDYDVYFSLKIPGMSSDVDMVVANGNTAVLVDAKKWRADKSYLTMPWGTTVPGEYRKSNGELSKNMAAAVDIYRRKLTGTTIKALVSFVPNGRVPREPKVSILGLFRLTWPGDIKSYRASETPRALRAMLGKPVPVDKRLHAHLTSLMVGQGKGGPR